MATGEDRRHGASVLFGATIGWVLNHVELPLQRLNYHRRLDLQEALVMALHRSESLFPDHATPRGQPGKRVVRNGEATNDLVLSAYANPNAEVFPRILDLYVRPGCVVADVTYGKGAFWRRIPEGRYRLSGRSMPARTTPTSSYSGNEGRVGRCGSRLNERYRDSSASHSRQHPGFNLEGCPLGVVPPSGEHESGRNRRRVSAAVSRR